MIHNKFRYILTLVALLAVTTGAWATDETLLTTITPTGDGTYSETTAGAVTVTPTGSFFYSGSSYGWRWDSYGSLTVTANEGYTITGCVFIQQGKNQSVTISEAPFALNFEEWLCLENTSMDGVTSIEVYGTAPAAPAGYAVSLKAETADEGNWTAKAGEGEYQSLPLEGVAQGTQVSLKYNGSKKVKSVKAVKKAAPAAGLTSYTLAESTVGMIVGTDGKAYDVADLGNLPSGVTAAGVVVYKNGANGLAIALTDEASMMDWATACGESGAAAHTPTVEGQTWKLPSQEELTLVKNANSGSSLNSAITNAGGTAIPTVHFDHETQIMTGRYWLSTQGAIDESARTWGINAYDEIVTDSQSFKTDNILVRACLAW